MYGHPRIPPPRLFGSQHGITAEVDSVSSRIVKSCACQNTDQCEVYTVLYRHVHQSRMSLKNGCG